MLLLFSRSLFAIQTNVEILFRNQVSLRDITILEEEEENRIRVEQTLETSGSFSSLPSEETSSFIFQLIMSNLRVCYLRYECIFNEECRIPRVRQLFKFVADSVFSGFNISFVPKDLKVKEDASPTVTSEEDLDPCLISLQNNESDVTFWSYSMPVMLNNIKTGQVSGSDQIAMVSTYKLDNDDSAKEGILGTFQAFSIDACCLIAHFFIILFALFSLAYIFERRRTRPDFKIDGRRFNLRFIPWFIFCFFAKQIPSFPGNMNLSKAILICNLLTYSYFVTFFYSSMIKTDMVTVKDPKIIGSYQDLLDDPEIQPFIAHLGDEYVSFKTAPEGSVKRKIWEGVLSLGIDKHVVDTKNMEVIMSLINPDGPFLNGKAVLCAFTFSVNGGKYMGGLVAKGLSKRKEDPRKIRFLYVYDDSESFVTTTYIMNALAPEEVAKKYLVRRTRLFESGIVYKFGEKYVLSFSKNFVSQFFEFGRDISDVDEYFSPRVMLPQAVIFKPDITYFMPLFALYLVLCFLAFLFLLIERWVAKE